jgi:hypothetical protein
MACVLGTDLWLAEYRVTLRLFRRVGCMGTDYGKSGLGLIRRVGWGLTSKSG